MYPVIFGSSLIPPLKKGGAQGGGFLERGKTEDLPVIVEWGHLALLFSMGLAVWQVGILGGFLYGPRRAINGSPVFLALGIALARLQFVMMLCALAILGYAFYTNDFSVAFVAANSNTQLPGIYRIAAIWGGHEGSMLLWVFLLTGWMFTVSYGAKRLPTDMQARVLVILSLVAFGFYAFLWFTSDPFARLFPAPTEGRDLNPLLQDPGLVGHPPVLYMGYVGFSVAFAFALAALWRGELDARWARWARPWTLLAWVFLTVGIVLGSWWAYRELGWGGFWFWDPVENASLMPWLAGTALLHSLKVTERRNAFKAWAALLSLCTFCLSLLGTFLVRSGVLISVHTFAVDPKRGAFILGFLSVVLAISLIAYVWRVNTLSEPIQLHWTTREAFLLGNNALLFVLLLVVLLGTLYPLIAEAAGQGTVSIGAPYFNAIARPWLLPLWTGLAIVPWLRWHQAVPHRLWYGPVLVFGVLACIVSSLLIWISGEPWRGWAVLGVAGVLWVSANTVARQWGMLVAHLGLGVCLLGVILCTSYGIEREVTLQVGESTSVGPYTVTLQNVSHLVGPNYTGARARVRIQRGHVTHLLYPESRIFNMSGTALARAAIDVGVFRDIYVALGQPLPDSSWGFRLYDKPFVRWIWVGGLLMAAGGFLAWFTCWRRRV